MPQQFILYIFIICNPSPPTVSAALNNRVGTETMLQVGMQVNLEVMEQDERIKCRNECTFVALEQHFSLTTIQCGNLAQK